MNKSATEAEWQAAIERSRIEQALTQVSQDEVEELRNKVATLEDRNATLEASADVDEGADVRLNWLQKILIRLALLRWDLS